MFNLRGSANGISVIMVSLVGFVHHLVLGLGFESHKYHVIVLLQTKTKNQKKNNAAFSLLKINKLVTEHDQPANWVQIKQN